MKVLYIIIRPFWDPNGISIYVKKLTNSLLNKNIDFDILTFSENVKYPQKKNYEGFTMYIYPTKRIHFNLKQPLVFYTYYYTIHFLLRFNKKYDIIHTHSFTFTYSLYSVLLSKIFKFKSVLTIHGGIREQTLNSKKRFNPFVILKRFYNNWMGKIQFSLADVLVFISLSKMLKFNKVYKIKRKDNIYYIPNGVKIEPKIISFEAINNRKYITFIGRIDHIKGFDIFLKIIKLIKKKTLKFPFLIVAKNYNQTYYNEMVALKKTVDITYYEEFFPISQIYLQSKILINSSRTEGISTTILEAMNFNTPVIASNIEGNREVIKDGYNGYLFDMNNIEDAVYKIEKIYDNREISEKFCYNSRNLLKKKFNWNNIVERNLEIYKKTFSQN